MGSTCLLHGVIRGGYVKAAMCLPQAWQGPRQCVCWGGGGGGGTPTSFFRPNFLCGRIIIMG